MLNEVYIYVHTSERVANHSHLYVALLSNVADWNSRKNFSPSNACYFPPGREADVNIRFRFDITPVQMFVDIMENLF